MSSCLAPYPATIAPANLITSDSALPEQLHLKDVLSLS